LRSVAAGETVGSEMRRKEVGRRENKEKNSKKRIVLRIAMNETPTLKRADIGGVVESFWEKIIGGWCRGKR